MQKIINKRLAHILTTNSIYAIDFKDVSVQKRALAISAHLSNLQTKEEEGDVYFNSQQNAFIRSLLRTEKTNLEIKEAWIKL